MPRITKKRNYRKRVTKKTIYKGGSFLAELQKKRGRTPSHNKIRRTSSEERRMANAINKARRNKTTSKKVSVKKGVGMNELSGKIALRRQRSNNQTTNPALEKALKKAREEAMARENKSKGLIPTKSVAYLGSNRPKAGFGLFDPKSAKAGLKPVSRAARRSTQQKPALKPKPSASKLASLRNR
jgi:hypothetical protein